MLTAERRREILTRLERDGKVVASELVADLGVSEDTVRRDLRELAAGGLV
jgi:DeoR/GlpR family transcriptional regulator of sugar metabolism